MSLHALVVSQEIHTDMLCMHAYVDNPDDFPCLQSNYILLELEPTC